MSWHFLQEQAEASWEQSSLDGAPYALLKLIPRRAACFSTGKETECCLDSRFGMTCALSTAEAGRAKSMWLREDSRARTSRRLEHIRGWMASEVGSGRTWLGSFAKYDHSSCSLKTLGDCGQKDSKKSSVILPTCGSMRNGTLYQRVKLAPHKCADECSYWPTPTATMAKSGFGHGKHSQGRYRSSVLKRCAEIGWSACPEMLEAVQGWPIGWTARGSLEMDRFREWLRLHGKHYSDEQSLDQR